MANKNTNLVWMVLIIALAVVSIIYIINSNSGPNQYDKTISATGNSQMQVEPDTLTVYINIETKDESAEIAKNQNSEITNNVLEALKDLGIPESDIQTLNYNIYPEYDWSNDRQDLIGYVVSNTIIVTTENFDLSGNIIDAAVDNGALVNSINFELSNDKLNEYKAQAIGLASKDAKTKAEALAEGLDKELGDLISVTSSDYNYIPYPIYERAGESFVEEDAKLAVADLQPRDLDVSATVSVTYKIK